MTIGPAPIIRMEERSVRFGIALPARIDRGAKKAALPAPPVNFHRPADGYPQEPPEPYPIISGEGRAWQAFPIESVERCTMDRVVWYCGSIAPQFGPAGDDRRHDMPAADLAGVAVRRSTITSTPTLPC